MIGSASGRNEAAGFTPYGGTTGKITALGCLGAVQYRVCSFHKLRGIRGILAGVEVAIKPREIAA
jgi:hypothetical protein